jgi:hypothetical protein
VAAGAVGTATITATTVDGNKAATCAATVEPYSVATFTLNKMALDLPHDEADTVSATIIPAVAPQTITWAVEPAAGVVTLSGTGLTATVTPVGVGFATITATAVGGKTATCEVKVSVKEAKIGMMGAKTLAANNYSSAGIKNDGSLMVWGQNTDGILGDGSNTQRTSPVRVGTATYKFVSMGYQHMAAIRDDGTLWTWGNNGSGQLGLGNTTTNTATRSPQQVSGGGNDWAAVACGNAHTVALKTNGQLWAWGRNTEGQLGDGTNTAKTVPTRIGTASNWAAVAAGYYFTAAVKSFGAVYTWGDNANGQLGQGNTTRANSPSRVGPDEDWVSVACAGGHGGNGGVHTLALKSSGELWAWGYNTDGSVGDGTNSQRVSPVRVGQDSDWKAISAGNRASQAIKTNGELWTWGWDDGDNALGNGEGSKRVPTIVPGGSTYAAAERGLYHMVTMRSDGTIWCIGYNSAGQLGRGNTTASAVFVQATNGTDFRPPGN